MTLSFKVDVRIKKALEYLAKGENRSLSNYVITLLMQHLDGLDVDWRQEKKPKK